MTLTIDRRYEGFFGAVGRVGDGSVRTLFYHFAGLPVFPQGTFWVVGAGLFLQPDTVLELRRSKASVVKGYLQGWSTGLAFLITGGAAAVFSSDGVSPLSIALAVLAVASLIVAAVVWGTSRHPVEGDELAKRMIFAQVLASASDPARWDDAESALTNMQGSLASRAEHLGVGDYWSCHAHWAQIAAQANMYDLPYLRMALTATRLAEGVHGPGAAPGLRATADHVWAKMCQLDPSVRELRP